MQTPLSASPFALPVPHPHRSELLGILRHRIAPLMAAMAVVVASLGTARGGAEAVAKDGATEPKPGSATPQSTAEGTFSVMTFNIRYDNPDDGADAWPNRRDAVAAFLREQAQDIVGLQEVLARQLEFLKNALPEYAVVGVGRDDGKAAGEFSPILYRRDRFDLKDSGTFWLSDTPEEPGSKSWGNNITRICTWARLVDRESGAAVHVYNTHFDHQSQPSRERSAELVLQRIAQRRPASEPAVLLGDFNAGESNPAILTLRQSLTETFRAAHPDGDEQGTFHGFSGNPGSAKIDHVFVTPDLSTRGAAIHTDPAPGGRHLSDHFPVSAELVPAKAER